MHRSAEENIDCVKKTEFTLVALYDLGPWMQNMLSARHNVIEALVS